MKAHIEDERGLPRLATALVAMLAAVVVVWSGLGGFIPSAEAAPIIADDMGQPAVSPTGQPLPAGTDRQQPVTVSARGGRDSAPQAPAPQSPVGRQLRVGIQAGHWLNDQLPAELASLRGSTGAAGSGWKEVDVNLDIARRVVAQLTQAGVQADLLPATVPSGYKADAFLALHGDANANTTLSGYKAARAQWSSIPAQDDALVNALGRDFQAATGLPNHTQTITPAMLQYYAFNHNLQHSVDPSTPAAILEMGFLTNPTDRGLLMQQPDQVAGAIAKGILDFLGMPTP